MGLQSTVQAMTPEIIAILTIGVTLGSGQLATVLWIKGRFERLEKSIAERFERTEQRFERAEQRSVERFEQAEQRSRARFEQAEQRSSARRFEQLLQVAAETRARLARIEGLVEGGVMCRASGTSRDPKRAERHAPSG